jgi:hypothetical protein
MQVRAQRSSNYVGGSSSQVFEAQPAVQSSERGQLHNVWSVASCNSA